jgi:hypothetical protein
MPRHTHAHTAALCAPRDTHTPCTTTPTGRDLQQLLLSRRLPGFNRL